MLKDWKVSKSASFVLFFNSLFLKHFFLNFPLYFIIGSKKKPGSTFGCSAGNLLRYISQLIRYSFSFQVHFLVFINCRWSGLSSAHSSGSFLLPLLSARHPGCTPVISLRTCLLSEITGIKSLASVLLLARVYVPFPKTFMFFLSQFHHLARSIPTAHTHKRTGRDFYVHVCTRMCVYTVTSLRGNLLTCRTTSFLL